MNWPAPGSHKVPVLVLAVRLANRDNPPMTNQSTHPQARALCRLDELSDPGSKGFSNGTSGILVVRQGSDVFVYENRCPHRGIPLEWTPDQFLDSSGRLIQCATHGALFLPESGECIAGPCSGDSLRKLDGYVHNGVVWLGKASPTGPLLQRGD